MKRFTVPARALEFCRRYLAVKGSGITAAERRDVESLIGRCR